jgi:hypothetical protein
MQTCVERRWKSHACLTLSSWRCHAVCRVTTVRSVVLYHLAAEAAPHMKISILAGLRITKSRYLTGVWRRDRAKVLFFVCVWSQPELGQWHRRNKRSETTKLLASRHSSLLCHTSELKTLLYFDVAFYIVAACILHSCTMAHQTLAAVRLYVLRHHFVFFWIPSSLWRSPDSWYTHKLWYLAVSFTLLEW